jgi:PAS domain S-box-containing protein
VSQAVPRPALREAESQIVKRLAEAATVDAAAHDVLAAVAEALDWDVAILWLLDERTRLLRSDASWHAPGDRLSAFVRACDRLTFVPGVGLPGRVWSTIEPEWIGDVAAAPGFPRAEIAERAGLSSALAIPVRGSQELLGVIELLSRRRREPDAGEAALLLAVAAQLAHYVARVRAEESLRASEERASAIFEAALDCVITMDEHGCVLDFNGAAETTFGYTRQEASGCPLAELIVPPHLREAHRAGLRRYLDTGAPGILNRRLELEGMRADGTTFPVELTVTRIGHRDPPVFAGFLRDITHRHQAEEDRRSLVREAVASRASEEAARVRAESAHDEAESERRRLEFLAGAGLRMASSMDYEKTLQAVAREAVPQIADRCTVTIVEPSGPRVLTAPGAGDDAPPPPAAIAATIATGRPELLSRSLTVPIRASGKVLGAISLELGESSRQFGEHDQVVATALAARAGLHIENARLYTERSHIAATLQRSLLPRALPQVPSLELAAHYRAAGDQNEVGGDFYDVFASEPGVWTAVIGDVSGKGAAAAALTALSRNTLFAGALGERSPARNLALLNEAMRRRNDDASFCTAVQVRICPGEGSAAVTLSSGGHPPPLILRAGGGVERVPATGTLVGVVAEARFEDVDARLGPGDLLLLYTDGAIELRRSELAFGERELERVLGEHAGMAAERVVTAIAQRVDELQDGSPRDDLALLAVRMLPSG